MCTLPDVVYLTTVPVSQSNVRLHHKQMLHRGFLYMQDADASYDVNGRDNDPQPRYDPTNENRSQHHLSVFFDFSHTT